MSSTTFPVSGTFGGQKSKPVRRSPAQQARPATTGRTAPAPQGTGKRGWMQFLGDAMATWATAGRLPLDR